MSDRDDEDDEAVDVPAEKNGAQSASSHQGPLDYPLVNSWLSNCQEDIEHGRDKHEYTKLIPVFEEHECTRIDDVARMSPEEIRGLATEMGVSVSLGLARRVFSYASEDVALVKAKGKIG